MGQASYLTISCGFVLSEACIDFTPEKLLKTADKALYEAKSTTCNRYVIRSAQPRY